MNYSDAIDKIIKSELNELIMTVKEKKGAFDKEKLVKYYEKYEKLLTKQKRFGNL